MVLSAVVVFTSSPLFLSSASAAEGGTVSGSFNVLSYNVGGLPDLVSSSNPKEYTVQISPKLNDYDIINVQEDFNYHNELISQVTLPYLTTTSGIAGFGSGLNSLSKYPFRDLKRVTWDKRSGLFDNGSDELTPKGFTAATYEITPQVKVDMYNLHADAGSDDKSLEARRDNIRQLSNYIKEHSDGNAVIVFGDTNTRYTRAADNIELLMSENGLRDPWIDLIRGGSIPLMGMLLWMQPIYMARTMKLSTKFCIAEVKRCPLMHRVIVWKIKHLLTRVGSNSPIIIRVQRNLCTAHLLSTN